MGNITLLLGAGASVDAGLPTTEAMVDRLLVDFRGERERSFEASRQLRLLEFIAYSLKSEAAARDDPVGVDVETMFDAIESLATRSELSITPFIAAWHPLVAEAERVLSADPTIWHESQLARLLNDAINDVPGARGFSSSFAAERFVRELLRPEPETGYAFASLAEAVLQSLVRILRLEDEDSVRYLSPLGDLYHEQGSLDVATLNYDLAVERLGDLVGVRVDDGMAIWHRKGRLEFEPGIRLLKLHGSINWHARQRERISPEEPFIPFEAIERLPGAAPGKPALIFGAGNKLRAGGPYLDLLRLFNESLEQSEALVIVGYSFRDDHVNATLTNWFNADRARRVVVLDPSADWLGPYRPGAEVSLGGELARLASRFSERVRFIQQTAAVGLSDAIAEASQEGPAG